MALPAELVCCSTASEGTVASIESVSDAFAHESEPLPLRLAQAALILVVSLTLNLAGNARTGLWDRDEPRYATCTREMRQGGDWIHPTFNGEPRYDKPILIYWLMLVGTAIGGDNPYGARLVSSIAGAATCLLVWAWGRRMFGPKVGLLASLMLATAPIFVAESKLATTDATLTLFLVGCQFAIWELCHRPSAKAASFFWVCLSLAMLTKGPVGPAMVAAAALASKCLAGSTAAWRRVHWLFGSLAFLLMTAPWFIAIAFASRGEFYRVAVGHHIIERISTGLEEHGAFPGYYVLTAFAVFFPWSALLPSSLASAWLNRKQNPDFAYLLGWVVGPLVLLELVSTKLVHYYLPAYPAMALMSAHLISRVAASDINLRRWPLGRISLGILAGLGISLSVALLAAGFVIPAFIRWPSLALALVIGIGSLHAMEKFHRGQTWRAAASLLATSGLVMWILGGWLLPASEPYRTSKAVGLRLAELSKATGAKPILAQFKEPGVVYMLDKPIPIMRSRTELVYQALDSGILASALAPIELKLLSSDPRLALELRETLDGFNISKARKETLHIVLIRPSQYLLSGQSPPLIVERRAQQGDATTIK
jgi:4-amino-4-deoxy-L-arabinose transferase-like glycosyltransferase